MALSSIQWTDYTFNPWIGCRKVAPECANCYAETLDRNRYSKTLAPGTKEKPVSHWGSGPRHRTKTWGEPLKWDRKARLAKEFYMAAIADPELRPNVLPYVRPRVFCASLADWLDDENVPIEWFADLLKLIYDTPNLDWLLLTKRPQNWKPRLKGVMRLFEDDPKITLATLPKEYHLAVNWACGDAPPNVWIGVSQGADQAAALAIPARIHFLSCEPMLKPLDTTHAGRFDWIIFGGESGSKARPVDIDWIRCGVQGCRQWGVAPFVKQLGANCIDGARMVLNDKHGGDMAEWPADLRVREFPVARAQEGGR